MPKKITGLFTDLEFEFMKIIWRKEEAMPDEIREELETINRGMSSGSIRNMLSIMREKGHIKRRKQGKAYLYSAKIDEHEARSQILHDVKDTVFNGSVSLVAAHLFDSGNIDKEELEKIRTYLDSLEGGTNNDRS